MARGVSATVYEGVQLGAYRLIERIGKGGMGEVWRAEHVLLGRHAAVKVLRATVSESEEIVTRFFNEARATTAIADPGIVQVFDFGYHTDGCAYIVMELLDGETLQRRLERRGLLAVEEALRLMRQVASSLGAAHAQRIVHRDLKPENIYVVRDPEVPGGERAKILDFGIAKLAADPVANATGTGALLGTPLYMSPEQCRGGRLVDQRSDVYSLGCVLYALLVGKPPFIAGGLGEVLALHMFQAPPLASQQRTDVPASVDALIARCLAKEPTARFADGSELAAAIDQLLSRVSLQAIGPRRSAQELPRHSAQDLLRYSAPDVQSLRTVATFAPPPAPALSAPRMRPTTTLSASVGQQESHEPSPRRAGARAIAMLAGTTVAAGVAAYLVLRPAHDEPHAASAAVAPAPAAAPAVSSIAPPPTPLETARKQIAATLASFRTWAASHAGASCPTVAELSTLIAGGVVDPWGHALAVTCTDQPANQMIGVSSAGPDGAFGTPDDILSWSLGADATAIVAGPRWRTIASPHRPSPAARVVSPSLPAPAASHATPAPAPAHVTPSPPPAPAQPQPPPPAKPAPSFEHTTLDGDGIPTSR